MHHGIRQHTHCGAVLIVHQDRTATCSDVGCPAVGLFERMLDAHTTFVPCRAVFDSQACPRCKASAVTAGLSGLPGS